MRKYNEYDGENTSYIVGAQPHRLAKKDGRYSGHKLQYDFEYTDKIHDKYSRSERRNFIQVANKIYCRQIIH